MTKSDSGTISVRSNQPLISRVEAARYLNISPQTLAEWNCRGYPKVPYFKLGKKCCYRQSDLDSFLESRRVDGAAGTFNPAYAELP